MSMNLIGPNGDFSTQIWTFKPPKGSSKQKINFVFNGKLPDDDGKDIEIKFNKLKICTDDGIEKYIWVLCSEPFEVKDDAA
jgi:hypothetical protein